MKMVNKKELMTLLNNNPNKIFAFFDDSCGELEFTKGGTFGAECIFCTPDSSTGEAVLVEYDWNPREYNPKQEIGILEVKDLELLRKRVTAALITMK